MVYKLIFCVAFVMVASASIGQQDSVVLRKIANEMLQHATAYDNLRVLCKKIGPRLSGSAGAARAVETTAAMLREAGADTVYLQPVMVPHWERGAKEIGYVNLPGRKQRPLRLCALGNSAGTGAKGIRAPLVEVTSVQGLHQLGRAGLSGKIVLLNVEMDPLYVETFRAYGAAAGARVNGPSIAARYGAVAVMIRSLASNADDYPHTGVTMYNDSFPKIPAVAISTNDAIWLSKQLQQSQSITAFIKTNCRMLRDVQSFNVVGELKGREFAGKIVTVGGHLDSWDLAEGAQDDGAGVVQSIEVIRTLKALGIQPKRTIRAVLFMNEENGGNGGAQYAAIAKKNNEQHLFALESDAGGFTPRAINFEATDSVFTHVQQWLPLFAPYGVYKFARGGSGSDVGHLRAMKVTLAGLSPDSQRYFDVHHAATDVFENVSKRELHLGAINMAAIIYLVSEYGL